MEHLPITSLSSSTLEMVGGVIFIAQAKELAVTTFWVPLTDSMHLGEVLLNELVLPLPQLAVGPVTPGPSEH